MENKRNKKLDTELHFRDTLTLTNMISSLQHYLPELKDAIQEYSEEAPHFELKFNFIGEVFNPFLYSYLDNPQRDLKLGKRIFHILELMARSPDWEIRNILGVGILNKLNPKQLEIAEKHMGPSTKRNLADYQSYRKQLGLK